MPSYGGRVGAPGIHPRLRRTPRRPALGFPRPKPHGSAAAVGPRPDTTGGSSLTACIGSGRGTGPGVAPGEQCRHGGLRGGQHADHGRRGTPNRAGRRCETA